MNRKKQIEDLVQNSKVLNEHWEWVPISVQVAKEKEFLEHLASGNVLYNGAWVKIAEARQLQKAEAAGDITIGIPSNKENLTIPPPEETSLLVEEMPTQIMPVPRAAMARHALIEAEEKKKKSNWVIRVFIPVASVLGAAGAAAYFFLR